MRMWIGMIGLLCACQAQAAPKVAVTDLAYQTHVQQYVQVISANNRFQSGPYNASGSSNYHALESRQNYIKQTELRMFNGDIKGEILKSGQFQLVQGTPYVANNKGDVYDIVKRIKAGHFKGADYVLFGSVSDIDFTQDVNALANTNSYSAILNLTLVANFSLINTRTLNITSAFTAMAEGQDTKLVNSRDARISLNRPRVVRETAKALGKDVARQLHAQLGKGTVPEGPYGETVLRNNLPADEAPKVLR